MVVDIDDFKGINDSLGHHAGDVVLQNVAARMISVVRSGDSVGRLGGDEFVIVLEGLQEANQAKQIGNKVLRACCCHLPIGDDHVDITASIGISVFPLEGTSPEELLRLADAAMYASKRNGKASLNGHVLGSQSPY
jgi:diguanylate cyclase (GGDEF)-like protein